MLRLIPRDVATEMPKPRRRVRRRDARFRPNWNAPAETLEVRIVPTTADVWTGAGLTSNFSDQNNWQGHVIPNMGDNLDFPAGSGNATPFDDMDGVGFGTITIDAAGYSLGSDAGISTTGIATTYTTGTSTISGGVTLASSPATPLSVAAGGTLDLNGTIAGSSGLTLTGGGTLILDGVTSNTYTGTTEVDSGTLQLAKLMNVTTVPGALIVGDGVDTAIVQDQADNQLGSSTAVTIAAGGSLDLAGNHDAVAGLTLHGGSVTTGAGTLALNGDVTDDDTTDPLTISGKLALGGSAVTFHLSGGATLELDASITGAGGLTLAGGGTLRLAGSGVNDYTGTTEVDAGTLELDVTNPTIPAIPGALTINNEATVRDLADYQMATGTIVSAIQGGTLDLNGHDDAISGLFFNGGSVTTGAGTLTLLGDIVVEDDVLATSSLSGKLALYQSIHVTVTPNVALDIAAAISGTGYGLSLDDLASLPGVSGLRAGGTLVFSGPSANTYTGTTTVAMGELQLSKPDGVAALAGPLVVGDSGGDTADVQDEANNQLGSGIAVTVHSNATLALYGHNDAVGPLLLLGGWVTTENAGTDTFGDLVLDGPVAADTTSTIYGFITLGADTTFTVAEGATLTLNGPIDGSHGLTLAYSQTLPDSSVHQGGGTLLMEGTMSGPTANTYSGTTAIQSGTLHLSKAVDTVAVPGLLIIGDPNGNTATVLEDSTQIQVGGTVEIYGGGLLQLADNDQGLSTLKLHGTHDGTVVETVNGVLTLSNAIVDDSTANLRIGGEVFLYDDVTVTVAVGGVLTLDAVVAGDDGKGLTLAAPIAPGGQGLASGGTLVMAGMSNNTYNGTTTVGAGVLLLDKGCGAVAIVGPLVIGGGGEPAVVRDQADGQLDGQHDVTLDQGGLLDLNGHDDGASNLILNGGTATSGAGVFTINDDVIYAGGAPTPTLLAANLNLNSASPEFNIHSGEYLVIQGIISGSSGFRLTGSGTLKLWGSSASNTYTGTTLLNMGTLILDNAAGTVAIPGDLVIGTGCPGNIVRELESGQIAPMSHVTVGYRSLLDLADNDQTVAGLAFDNGTILLGAGTLTLDGDVTATGWGKIDNNRTINGPNVNNAPEGRLDLGGARIFDVSDGADIAINALVTDGSVIKDGLGELDLYDDSNNYTGSTQVNAGTLYAGGWNALGQTSGATVANGATLVLDGVTTSNLAIALGGGSGTTDSTLKIYEGNNNAVTPSNNTNTITNLVLDGDATVYVGSGIAENVDGISSGDSVNHRLTDQGGGSLHVVGSVTNDGAIVVDGGTLDVAAANALTGAVTVDNNGQLGGSSPVGGVASTGGTVGAIGSYSPQTLTVASLGLDSNSFFRVDINGNTPGTGGYDQVVSAGAVDLGGAALSITLGGYTPQAGDTFTIIKGLGAPTSTFNGLPEGALIQAGAYSFRITYKGGALADDVVLSYVQASTTTLASSSFLSNYGQTVTFTATVTASVGSPIGSVTFTEGSTVLGTVPLTPLGTAVLPLGNLSVGYHRIVATYGGASAFTASASTTLGQVIKQGATGTSLGLSASPISIGQSVTLTATVAPTVGSGTPSGTVSFYDGSTRLGTVTLAAGTATFATSTLAAGSHALTAVYGGATNYVAGTSSATPLAVNPISTSTVLGTSTSSIVVGQSASFVAYVSCHTPGSGSPAGSVTFMDGSNVLGHVTLANSWATLVTTGLGLGGHGVTAVYSGNATTAASQSTAVSAVVNPDASTTTLSSSVPQSVTGQSVTLTATVAVVTPGTASQAGTVTFMDGQTVLGTAPVVGGKATLAVASMGFGYHYLYAIYGGNAQVIASYSPAIGQTVFKANTGTGFVSSARVATYGQMVTYSAAVAAIAPGAGSPTGSVSFYDGSTLLGSAKLSGGTASLTVAATGVGLNHPITVRYSGDANYVASVSDVVTETVVKASAQVAALEQVFAGAVGFPTAVLAATPAMATPTGTVTFFANGKQIGQATLVNGAAGIALLGRGVLLQSVTVLYSGDANYNAATVVPKIIFA